MVTTKINIKPHLAEYVKGRFVGCQDKPVQFPAGSDIYIIIWDLMSKRPADAPPIDRGNLEIILPSRSIGKRPEYYNYLSKRSQTIIEKKIEEIMFEELHHRLRFNKRKGITYIDSIHWFMCEYAINSISEDAYKKEFYRLRRNEFNRRKKDKKYCDQTA